MDQALGRAAHLDAHLQSTGKVVGPLHGLPISLKDQLSIKGLETTMGKNQPIINVVFPYLSIRVCFMDWEVRGS